MKTKNAVSLPQNACVSYLRVSTAPQAVEGESLEVQDEINRNIIRQRSLNLVKVFSEPFTGRTDHRPAYADMVQFIKHHKGQVPYVIIRGIDRFTRAGVFEYEKMKRDLAKLGTQIIDSYGIIQPVQNTLAHLGVEYDWSTFSPSEISEFVLAYQSKREVTDILTRTIGQEIRLVRQGYKVRQPTDGYVNKKIKVNGKKKTIEVPDPSRAHFFVEMFTLRAAGTYSDQEIVDAVNAMGFRTRQRNRWNESRTQVIGKSGGVPLSVKQLQRFIQRPQYCGINVEKWTNYLPVKTEYPGLISIETFNKANRGKVYVRQRDNDIQILYDSNPLKIRKTRNKNNPLFLFKCILCPRCRNPVYGSSPQGKSGKRFPTYHCSRGHVYWGKSKKEFEGAIRRYVTGLRFAPEYFDKLKAKLITVYRKRQRSAATVSAHVSERIATLEKEKIAISDAFVQPTTSEAMREELDKRMNDVKAKLETIRKKRHEIEITEDDIDDCVEYAKAIMEHPEKFLMDQENFEVQRGLFGLVFEETPTYDEIAFGTPKLSCIFTLSSDFRQPKSQVASPNILNWNTLVKVVLSWKFTLEHLKTLMPKGIF